MKAQEQYGMALQWKLRLSRKGLLGGVRRREGGGKEEGEGLVGGSGGL